ncbi:hypothetical protein BDV19DRAFT_386537 [Aspergillus venezuelensis]
MSLHVPDNTPDRGQGVVILCIIVIALTILVTLIRILSKVVTKQYWWWDDFFAVLGLLFELILLSLLLAWRNVGLGYHTETIVANNPSHLTTGAKYLYSAVFFFDGSVCFPKLSALFFYARVFKTNNRIFTINLWLAGSLTAAWLLSAWISTGLECRPLAKAWDPALPGSCINTYAWYLATAIISSLIDLHILLLPVPSIWRLQISLRRRVYVLVTFFMAYSVIVLSIGRIVAISRIVPRLEEDLSWEFPLYLYWVVCEVAVSIISISVPSGLALYKFVMRRYSLAARFSAGSSSGNQGSNRSGGRASKWSKVSSSSTQSGTERDRTGRMVAAVNAAAASRGEGGGDIPLRDITVSTDIRVERSSQDNV